MNGPFMRDVHNATTSSLKQNLAGVVAASVRSLGVRDGGLALLSSKILKALGVGLYVVRRGFGGFTKNFPNFPLFELFLTVSLFRTFYLFKVCFDAKWQGRRVEGTGNSTSVTPANFFGLPCTDFIIPRDPAGSPALFPVPSYTSLERIGMRNGK